MVCTLLLQAVLVLTRVDSAPQNQEIGLEFRPAAQGPAHEHSQRYGGEGSIVLFFGRDPWGVLEVVERFDLGRMSNLSLPPMHRLITFCSAAISFPLLSSANLE